MPVLLSDYERLRRLPEAVVRESAVPLDRRPRMVGAGFADSLQSAFSGSSWYLTHGGISQGVIDGAFTLQSDKHTDWRLAATGAAWKAQRIARRLESGGFKFEAAFQDIVWDQNIEHLRDTLILSNFQLFGRNFFKRNDALGITPCFYVDGTLSEYFYTYAQVEKIAIGKDVMARAIEREREGYHRSPRIIAMSQSTMKNLQEVYGVPADRIRMVMPGANLYDEDIPPPSTHSGWVGDEFTLGFVGLFPIRKGLDKLAAAVSVLRGRGAPIRLKVIGRCPDEIAAMDGVDFLGTINKRTETARFIEEIRGCDLGCQLSRAEMFGVAMMEFVRVGVPVMATAIGGMPDMMAGGGGVLVPGEVTVDELVETLDGLMTDPERYAALRESAVRRAEWASWSRAAREIDAALEGLG